jgi:outer membrane immunogenic protein
LKKIMFAAAGLVVLAAPALAADLAPAPAPRAYQAPASIPVSTWTGFYLGAYGGGGDGRSRWDFPAVGTTTGGFGINGGFAGGTAGFNWQIGSALLGIEGDGGWAGFKGSAPDVVPTFTVRTSDSWLSSVRGRLGWVVDSSLLLYGTGGVAFGDVTTAVPVVPPGGVPSTGATGTNVGWAAGAGAEWMFAPSWSAKLEYMHYDLGTFSCPAGGCGINPANVRFSVDTGKVGINYHFNWAGPVVARY